MGKGDGHFRQAGGRLAGVRDKRRSGGAVEKRHDGLVEKGKCRARLLGTRGNHGPGPFRPASAGFAARALRHVPIEDHKANRLLDQVVGGLHAWRGQKSHVTFAVLFETPRVRITSRTVSEVTYRLSEFQDNLPHLTEGLSQLAGTILDGELLCPQSTIDTDSTATGTSLQATMAVLATSPDNARQIQESQNAHLRFHVFDILRCCGQDVTSLPLVERHHFLEKAMRELNNPFIEPVPSYVVNKAQVHQNLIAAGGEGTVWKRADQPYEPGRRVKHWIKRKQGIEFEAFVSGSKPGANGHASLVGAIEFSIKQADGATVPVAWVSSFRDSERIAMTHHDDDGVPKISPEALGKRAVISGQEMSARSKRLRHARLAISRPARNRGRSSARNTRNKSSAGWRQAPRGRSKLP